MEFLNTFGMSMLPIGGVEESLPLGMTLGMSAWESYGTAVLGNLFPIPFLLIVLKELVGLVDQRNGAGARREGTAEEMVPGRMGRFSGRELAVLVLTAIPSPVTGAWIGAVAAAAFRMSLKKSLVILLMGLVISGLIVLTINRISQFM